MLGDHLIICTGLKKLKNPPAGETEARTHTGTTTRRAVSLIDISVVAGRKHTPSEKRYMIKPQL
jgi:hypothetical protein